MSKIMKLLFHTHTDYSSDCLVSIGELHGLCRKNNLMPCITDHNTIKGAVAYRKKFGLDSCIIGEEIKTKEGEVIGLYMKKEIPKGLSLKDTMKMLKSQNAIIIIPHPFDRFRKSRLMHDINNLNKSFKIDFIEVFNSRTLNTKDNDKAQRFFDVNSKRHKFLAIAGADAHLLHENMNCCNIVPDFDVRKKELFIKAFSSGKVKFQRKKSGLRVHIVTKAVKILGINRNKEHK
jgi:predicted metal-dependent phosphoesterase TrpH